MMNTVAVLADVHGNLPALEAVIADMPYVDAVVSAGDLVSGPFPRGCLLALETLGVPVFWVRGNADRRAADPFNATDPGDGWAGTFLDEGTRGRIAKWPTTVELEIRGLGKVCVCHGSPRDDEEVLTTISPDERVAAACEGVDAEIVVGGHVHRQMDRVVGRTRLVNAGSVGMPYEGRRGAFWALLGPDVELRCTEYDPFAAAERMHATDYPSSGIMLDSHLEDPDIVSAFFESGA